jgi:aminopeptidase N
MRQLERIVGPERFQEGLRVYLTQFQFGNATWIDLVRVLDERTDIDLAAWSRAWVEEAGRPSIRTELELNEHGGLRRLAFVQADFQPARSLKWTQHMEVLLGTQDGLRSIPVELRDERFEIQNTASLPLPDFVLPAGGGLAYGGFTLDEKSREYLLRHVAKLKDPVARGAAWVTLWDEMLDGRIHPSELVGAAMRALPEENTEQNVQLVAAYLEQAFWRFLSDSARQTVAPKMERILRSGLTRAASPTMKSTYFSAFRSVVTTNDGIAFLERVWSRKERIRGLTFAETDEAAMAMELAARSVPAAAAILEEQLERFQNPDRKAQFEFVMPALSNRQETRDAFFQSLADVKNRRREPWVLEAVRYLHHPLRARQAEKFLRPALELVQEIQRTGDIFFPKRWMDATLNGHQSRSAAATVRAFLDEHKDYPVRLRRIILQSADDLFRAAEIVSHSPP